MRIKPELIDWLKLRGTELINLDYELIDSLNEPEIDAAVRSIRRHLLQLEDALHQIKVITEFQLQREINEAK